MSKATDILDDIKHRLEDDPRFQDRCTNVLSEEDLFDKLKPGVQYPIVGIMYEGSRSTSQAGQSSHKNGLSAEIGVALILAMEGKSQFGANVETTALSVLDLMRNILKDQVSPAGHYYRFVLEAPAMEKNGIVLWLQRWTTPAQLTG